MTFYIQKGQSSTSLWHHNVQVFFLNYCGRLQFPHHSTQFMFSSDAFLFFSCLFREAKLGTHLISCKSWFTISLPFTAFCLYLHTIFFTSLKHKAASWGFWGVFLFFFCLFAFSQFFLHDTQIKNIHQNGRGVLETHSGDALKCIDLGRNTIHFHVNIKCVCLQDNSTGHL